MSSYTFFADQLLMAVYRENGANPQKPCLLRQVIATHGLENDAEWLATVTTEFHDKGFWTVEIGSGPLVHLTAAGIRHAEHLIELDRQGRGAGPGTHVFPAPPVAPGWQFWHHEIDWAKWGSIAGVIAIPLAIALWLRS